MPDKLPAAADPKQAVVTPSAPLAKPSAEPVANQTDVYAIQGADPEVLAYAMAKYSRSALSMKESLAEISTQRAEEFLNTFYFQYGHRSIADLAHIPFAIERLSLLAAVALVDEQRWDGQERSTRYQNFRKSGWYTPALGERTASYTASIEALFAAYDRVGAGMLEALKRAIRQPAEMKDEAYVRTLKARAFDVARYVLPLATNTSLGQIVSARTLENQISRLLASEFAEVRGLGERLKAAAAAPAWNVTHDEARVLLAEAASFTIPDEQGREGFHSRLSEALLRDVKTAPTLVKYSAANEYAIATRAEMRQAAAELMAGQAIEDAPVVDLVEDAESLEVELATSLLYAESHTSWRQIQRTVAGLDSRKIAEIVALGVKHRGPHDELPRAFSAGQSFRFDILMDIGGFRDMHRHRRCVQAHPALYRPARLRDTGVPRPAHSGRGWTRPNLHRCNGRCARCLPRAARCGGAGGCCVSAAAGDARAGGVQDGLRRGALHRRAAQRCCGALQLSARGLGDVLRRGQAASGAGRLFPD